MATEGEAMSQTALDVRQIVDLFRLPGDKDRPMLVSAHRGLRWNGVPENSAEAVLNAVRFGLLCIEIDVRLTSDGHAVVLHDHGLGRVTDIAEYMGRDDVYNPWTGVGYTPKVNSLPWHGVVENLRLKDENGRITDHGVLDLETLLNFIREQELNIVVFLDIKSKEAVPVTASILAKHCNASGIPALEWCVFKLDAKFYPTPEELEATKWWKDAQRAGNPLYIPVFEPDAYSYTDVLSSAKAFAARSYCVALELGLRSPGGLLQEVVDIAAASGTSIGFFAALGDVHPADGSPILMDTSNVDVQKCRRPDGDLICFHEGHEPLSYKTVMELTGGGVDDRWDLDAYKRMGYSWAIADLTSRSVDLFAGQALYQQPSDKPWHGKRLADAAGTAERARM